MVHSWNSYHSPLLAQRVDFTVAENEWCGRRLPWEQFLWTSDCFSSKKTFFSFENHSPNICPGTCSLSLSFIRSLNSGEGMEIERKWKTHKERNFSFTRNNLKFLSLYLKANKSFKVAKKKTKGQEGDYVSLEELGCFLINVEWELLSQALTCVHAASSLVLYQRLLCFDCLTMLILAVLSKVKTVWGLNIDREQYSLDFPLLDWP